MSNTNDHKVPSNYKQWPWATMLALLLTIALSVNHFVDEEALSFDKLTTYVAVVWGFLAVGRGLAKRDYDTEDLHPLDRFLHTFPWATAVVAVVAVVGYVGTLSDSLSVEELGLKLSILIGALGLGRGIGKYKDDTTTHQYGGAEMLDGHIDGPNGPGVEVTEDNMGAMGGGPVEELPAPHKAPPLGM